MGVGTIKNFEVPNLVRSVRDLLLKTIWKPLLNFLGLTNLWHFFVKALVLWKEKQKISPTTSNFWSVTMYVGIYYILWKMIVIYRRWHICNSSTLDNISMMLSKIYLVKIFYSHSTLYNIWRLWFSCKREVFIFKIKFKNIFKQ